ncbi:single-stranded-DNA-specific exonuclease RecJ [bacterium]|nr:MAG: single-stranded-DNA-specific exonuclease RecJ [bacterium]
MSFRWLFQEPEEATVVSGLADAINVSPTLARLLVLRNVRTFDEAKLFFRPDLSQLHNPFIMKDMDKAASRLAQAVRNGETVVVYGDYDVDGTTATSMMYMFLLEFGCNAKYYIPHRFKEGYGISEDGIEYAKNINASLIVSVDCGITAIQEAEMIREMGMELIVCDHHTTGDVLPNAYAVLDPKRPDCPYPFDGLSGAGVGFKLMQATLMELGLPPAVVYKYLDLLAISIASDIVPIVGENRILMREGLAMLNSEPRSGVKALLDLINLPAGTLTTNKIVFSIGPRINAAGRLGDARTAVELLIASDDGGAKISALELEAVNLRRRTIDTETMNTAIQILDEQADLEQESSLVLHHPEWHLGVIGIVASRLVDKYYRPTVMLSTIDGLAKGSARSIRGFNIYDALKECEDLLIQFGGHEYAAGLTLAEENIEAFRLKFNRIVNERLADKEFEPELLVDAEIKLEEITPQFWKILRQFEPYGPLNLKPNFVSRNVRAVGTPTIVGNGHLKFQLTQDGVSKFDAIGFNMHEFLPLVRDSVRNPVDIAYTIEENLWNGKTTLQLRIKDVHPTEEK